MIDDLDLRAETVILHKDAWLEDVVLPDPRLLGFQEVLRILRDKVFEELHDKQITIYSIDTILNLWRAAYDLPEINAAIRLVYVVDHYQGALEYDLQSHLGVDLGELWQQRRWGRLLSLIDRLPSHTWYAQAVSEDEEHTAMLAKQLAEAELSGERREDPDPPISTWSPEVAKLTDIQDTLKELVHITVSMNAEQKVPEPKFAARPNSSLKRQADRIKQEMREERHQKLVARVLPDR